MKKWKKITVEEGLMKDIQNIVEGSNESKSGFATNAIEKEINRIKKERTELDMQELVDEFRNNAVPYSKKGIKNLNDFASQLKTNTKDIKRLEKTIKEVHSREKEVLRTFRAINKGLMVVEDVKGKHIYRKVTEKAIVKRGKRTRK